MEIEAKYALTKPLEPADLEAVDLHQYQLRPSGDERHHDVLLDTAGRALTSHGHALRLRRFDDGRVVATYKGASAGNGAVYERDEVEAPVSDASEKDSLRLCRQFPPAIAERIEPVAGDAPLAPLVETQIHRHTWVVQRDGETVAEVALDSGSINANGLSSPVRELEVELKKGGTRDDLEALSRFLSKQLPLTPEPLSKLARGLALLDRERIRQARRPLEEAGRAAVAAQLESMRKHEPEVREGSDPEAVHKMRVATRRLRTTLRSLEGAPIFEQKRLRKFRSGLKRLADSLGEVRDLDILSARVRAYGQAQPDLEADLGRLRDLLAERREVARERLLTCLESKKLTRLRDQLDTFANTPIEPDSDEPPLLVRHFAGSAIWARFETVQRYDTVVADADPPLLHQARIACKQLRYAVELFELALGERAQPLLDPLVRIQDHLGSLHDTVVAFDLVTRLNERHPSNGLAIYAAALGAERDQLHRSAPPLWQQISGEHFHHDVLAVLGSL